MTDAPPPLGIIGARPTRSSLPVYRRPMSVRTLLAPFLICVLLVGLLGQVFPARAQTTAEPRFSVLVFTGTEGPRHASTPAGSRALRRLGAAHDFRVDTTTAVSAFAPDRLARYDAVVFLNTSGDVLSEAQERAFRSYVEAGHGFVGVHAAAAAEPDWDWYGGLVGARADTATGVQPATVHVSDPVHPATRSLPVAWARTDAWYDYQSNPRGTVHVLATLDEQSYDGGTMGPDHPIAWAHRHDGGRSFYTGGGHTAESFSDPQFRAHLLGGLEWAAGAADGAAAATVNSSYETVVLDSTTTDPMDLDVAPDGRVFYVERRGVIRIWDPATGRRTLAGYLPVTTEEEDGLIGVALAPDFAETRQLYLYYSPPEGPPRNQLSRFPVEGNRVALDRETEILTVPTQRKQCCHTGGSIAFGPEDETLYLSTGDDTNPFGSSGFAPIDERPDRAYWDAQRTSANTQDLRGKILRIRPRPDGGYAIPEGNLFADPERGRPEIYAMGLRNPYRITVDDETGWLYWGDIGPDAGAPDSARGPAGHDEFNQARSAGNFGWPYFVGDNKAYHDYDFAADTSGPAFDPAAPINDSPNNTGARRLPPAQPPMIWYPYGPSEAFPEMGVGSRSAMVGPAVHHSAETTGPPGLPEYFDGSLLIYEWARNWIKEVTFDSTGHPAAINPLFTDKTFVRPMDVELGPEGRLYVLQWGNNFGGGPNSQILRLDYYGTPERPPVAVAHASDSSGSVPRTVTFRADTAQAAPAGDLIYAWDLDGDGTTDGRGPTVTHRYERAGRYTARLTVTDAEGRSATDSVAVAAGNTAPTVSIDWPRPGGVVPFDTPIPYRISVSDPEDESIAADRLAVRSFVGRDSHELPLNAQSGPTGTFEVHRTGHYDPKERLFAALGARYTDGGAAGVAPLTGRAHLLLHPRTMEAELAPTSRIAQTETLRNDEGPTRRAVTVENGHHVAYPAVNLRNIDALTLEVAPMAGGRIEVRRGAPDGPLIAETSVPTAPPDSTVGDSAAADRDYGTLGTEAGDWRETTVSVTEAPSGPRALYLVFRGREGAPLLRLDRFHFEGPGMTQAPPR